MYSQILPVCLFVCFSCIFSLSSSSSVLSPPLKVNFPYFLSSPGNANLFSSCPSCISFSIFLVLRFQSSFFFCLLFQVFSFFKVFVHLLHISAMNPLCNSEGIMKLLQLLSCLFFPSMPTLPFI